MSALLSRPRNGLGFYLRLLFRLGLLRCTRCRLSVAIRSWFVSPRTILNPPQRRLTDKNKSPSSKTRPRSTPSKPSFLSGENRHTSLENQSCLSSKEFSHGPLKKSPLSHRREHSLEAPSRHVLSPKPLSRTLPVARWTLISPSLALLASCAYPQRPLPPCPVGFVSS